MTARPRQPDLNPGQPRPAPPPAQALALVRQPATARQIGEAGPAAPQQLGRSSDATRFIPSRA
jgi:hypothetical protein